MKSPLLATALVVLTAATVLLYPAERSGGAVTPMAIPHPSQGSPQRKVEVVFVLDTTGSMSGLIDTAKEKIWSIASTLASAQPAPELRMGLVAYRDRGDDYVTRAIDLSSDLDSMYATLMDFRAEGGGDTPESVNQALHDAVHRMSWSHDEDTYRVIFLVGDAPPHMDYANDVRYPRTLEAALARGIVVNTVQCGDDPDARREWTRIARLAQGRFFAVEQAGGALAVNTPFDEAIARLSEALDATRLYYGSEEALADKAEKVAATEKLHAGASHASRARRAAFNLSPAGRANLFGEGDLVEDVASGRVALEALPPATLPAPLQSLPADEQQRLVAEKAEERSRLETELRQLAADREAYIAREVAGAEAAKESLERKIFDTVSEQGAARGLSYGDGPDY